MSTKNLNTGQFNWNLYASNIQSNAGQNLTLDASGNSSLLLRTNGSTRLTIDSSGAWTWQGGMSYNNVTNALTATTFIGDLSGNATNIAGGAGGSIPYQSSANTTALLANGTAGQVLTSQGTTLAPTWTTPSSGSATTIDITETNTNSTFYPTFVDSSGTSKTLRADTSTTPLSYNPSTSTLTATTFIGDLSGNATNATNAVNIGVSTNNTSSFFFPAFFSNVAGNLPPLTNTSFTYQPSTNTLSCNLNGIVNDAVNAYNIDVAAVNTNATFYPTFVSATTGQLPPNVDTNLTFNPSTNTLTTTNFSGLASTATNIAGGAGGSIPYQSSANTTALLANGTAGQVLTSSGGTSAPTWTTISVPSPTLTQTEDFVYFPKLILDAPYPDLAGIIGTQIPLAVYNYNGATVQPYNGNYNANLNSGALQRLGCMLLYSGSPGYTQHTGINEYSFTQISKITWGFCCLGNNTPDGFHTLTSNVTYTFGLALSSDRASSLFADNTSNSIFWCWNGSTYSPPTTTQFRLVINNVDRYTLTTNTNMTGKWARAGFTITYVSGNTADVQGFFTDLSTGVTETTGTYTITGGVGFPNPITNPNACSVYQSIYADAGNPRWLLIDYCQVETPNLYQIGVGSTQITGR